MFTSKKKLEKIGAKVVYIPPFKNKVSLFLSLLMLNLNIIKYRFNNSIFICHFVSTFIFSYVTLIPFNKYLIVYVEGLVSVFTKNVIYQKILKVLLIKSNAKRLFCNANERKLVGLKSDIVTGGIGIDLNKFSFSSSFKEGATTFNLLFVGRLLEDKGILLAIKTLRKLMNDGFSVKLNIVGDIYPNNPTSLNDEDIKNLKDEFGDNLIFNGYQDNMVEWYEKSDILLLPSKREGFPVCVMEANAMGLPAICFRVPGCQDAIVDNVNGFLVAPFNIDEYSEVIKKILNNEAIMRLKKTSTDYANKNFNSDKKSNELITIIKSIV